MSAGGAPGASTQIRIRGGSSLSASNDPLYVIDGVPIDNDGISGARNQNNMINPSDIETLTVLKDASATAIYGSTSFKWCYHCYNQKRKSWSPLKLEYNGNFSLFTPTKTIDVMNADQLVNQMNLKYPGQIILGGYDSKVNR